MPQKENEITLNSIPYKIDGQVRPRLASVLPGKVVIGDYTKDSEVIASSWVTNDLRGGMLIEELDEAVDQQRCWWTTSDVRFKNGIVLPPLATAATLPTLPTISNGNLDNWSSGTNCDDWTETLTGAGAITQESTIVHDSTYAAKLIATAAGTAEFSQALAGAGLFVATLWVRSTVAGSATVTVTLSGGDSATTIDDFTYRQYYLVGTGTETLSTKVTYNAGAGTAYVADVSVVSIGDFTYADFNSNLYIGSGNYLLKVDDTTGAITVHKAFKNVITALEVNDDGELYIFFGNSVAPSKMDTSDVVTGSGWTSGYYAKLMSGELYNIDTDDGEFRADNTSKATLNPITYGAVKGLDVYRDADQATTLYARLNTGLLAYDATSDLWLQTEMTLPKGTNTGAGGIVWRDAYYISAGLDVLKYVVAGTSTIQNVGLNKDGGVPSEYDGEIVSLIEGYNSFYALVDSSQGGGAGTSFVAEYTGSAWQTIWTDPDGAGNAMSDGIESSVYERRLWFACNNKLYYILRQSSLLNPKKLTTQAYATDSVLYTGWFDASTFWKKKAIRLRVQAQDVTPSSNRWPSSLSGVDVNVIIADWTALSGAVLTIVINGVTTTLTEGVHWTAATGNSQTALSIATYLINNTPTGMGTIGSGVSGGRDGLHFGSSAGYAIDSVTTSDSTNMPVEHETIVVSYRIDHEETDLDTGWTILTTVNMDTANEYDFGSSAGVSFSAVQFKYEFHRGSNTTFSPRLIWSSLVYTHTLPVAWGWQVTVDLTAPYRGRSVEQMWADLVSVAGSEVLVPFTFINDAGGPETNYVDIRAVSGTTATGYRKEGKYSLTLLAP